MATWTSRLLASLAQTPRPCSPAASVRSRMRNPLLPPTLCKILQVELHFAPVRGVIVHGGLVSRMAPEEVEAARWSAVGGLRDPHAGAQ